MLTAFALNRVDLFLPAVAGYLIGAPRWQPGALPSTASKVGIFSVIVHLLCIAMHGPALGGFESILAGTSYARGRARVRGCYG
jgi:hypothetical protein